MDEAETLGSYSSRLPSSVGPNGTLMVSDLNGERLGFSWAVSLAGFSCGFSGGSDANHANHANHALGQLIIGVGNVECIWTTVLYCTVLYYTYLRSGPRLS